MHTTHLLLNAYYNGGVTGTTGPGRARAAYNTKRVVSYAATLHPLLQKQKKNTSS